MASTPAMLADRSAATECRFAGRIVIIVAVLDRLPASDDIYALASTGPLGRGSCTTGFNLLTSIL